MSQKAVFSILSVLVVLVLVGGACTSGFAAGAFFAPQANEIVSGLGVDLGTAPATAAPSAQANTPDNLEELFKPFWQVWQLVHAEYVKQPLDDTALMRGAIHGMLESLGDEHTSYMEPVQYKDLTSELNGSYEGIGAWVDSRGDFLTIISPMPDSPAEKGGLKAGDQIVGIDGKDMKGTDPELVRQKVLGPKGSVVTLTILRKDVENPFDVKITRERITVPSVESKMLEGDIAYVRLFTFGDKTGDDLHKELEKLMENNPKGLILDLRNNGGGYLKTAIQIASEFIGDGVVMYEQYGSGKRQTFYADPGGLATKVPMVVLVNEGSASASEIVAGAIQDRGRGKLVGVKSFGKGSVQNIEPLSDNQGAVRITIALWLTPKERQIHQIGLTPDVVVELTDEDINANKDPQLQKAIDTLLNK
jgi:carboxyl-terminal processing protease